MGSLAASASIPDSDGVIRGCFRKSDGRLRVINGNGGGIFNKGGTLEVADSTFSGNSAWGEFSGGVHFHGGAISNADPWSNKPSSLYITNSTFVGNSASGEGGGIYSFGRSSVLSITDSVVSGNHARQRGGGLASVLGLDTITDSTISGNTVSGDGTATGGGIYRQGELPLTISNSTISGNTASGNLRGFGGGISNVGLILTISNSRISGNTATGSDIGIGGGIDNYGTLTVTDSTIEGNTASGTSDNAFGGGIFNSGSVSIAGSTILANTASGDFDVRGGGILLSGGGGSPVNITNSTISGNRVLGGNGGLYSGGGGVNINQGLVTVTSSTISGNTAAGLNTGGGIFGSYSYSTTLRNTIVANNVSGGDCAHGIIDGGYNISSDASCGFSGTSLASTDPLLGPLANNGGPTQTMLPGSGSPAIDGGGSGPCATASDQRGISRPQGTACDIGAVEVEVVTYPFKGFLFPVANPPKTNAWVAGLPVPISFGLGGNQGSGVVTGATVTPIDCTTKAPSGPASAASISKVVYLKKLGVYSFLWNTTKAWKGTCRMFTMTLDDETAHSAYFQFKKWSANRSG